MVIYLCSVAHVYLIMEEFNGKPSVSEEARSLCSHMFKGAMLEKQKTITQQIAFVYWGRGFQAIIILKGFLYLQEPNY